MDPSRLTLYYFPTCPFCLRVLWALKKLHLHLELKNIHKDAEAREELVAGGGRSTVPCLRITESDGTHRWMYESADIVAFLHREFQAA
jgi:glutaredoxin